MTLVVDIFPKLETVKNMVWLMSKKSRFKTHFDSEHFKGSKTIPKSSRQHFCYIASSLRDKLSWEMSLLVIFEILGLFVNTLTADDKYSLRNTENLP